MENHFSIKVFKKEMYYQPSWYSDQEIFFKLLHKKKLLSQDYINLSRLYIRYNHLDKKSLRQYFNIILNKTNKKNIEDILEEVRYENTHLT